MARRMIAAIGAAGWALLSVVALAAPADAGGGARLVADREHYRPGDAVHLTAMVTKVDLDWFGPYTAYLRPFLADGGSADAPGVDEKDIAIGRLVVTRLDPRTVRAELTFVLPKVTDGEWSVLYCNPGCTHPLGDLVGGWLQVGEPPALPPTTMAAAPPTTVLPVPTTRLAPVTTSVPTTRADPATTAAARSASAPIDADADADAVPVGELSWWAVGALAVAVLAAALAAVARRTRGRRSVTTSVTPSIDDGEAVVVELQPAPTSGDQPIGAGR